MEIDVDYRGKDLGLYMLKNHEHIFNPYYKFEKYTLNAVNHDYSEKLVRYYEKIGFEIDYNTFFCTMDYLIPMVKNLKK